MYNEKVAVEKFLGAPYQWRGRGTPGYDCWEFFKAFYKEAGWDVHIHVPEENYPTDYKDPAFHQRFVENYWKLWSQVEKATSLDGVAFKNKFGCVTHVGVVLTGGRFIHCPKAGVVISNLDEPFWASRVAGFYRFKGAHQ